LGLTCICFTALQAEPDCVLIAVVEPKFVSGQVDCYFAKRIEQLSEPLQKLRLAS